MLESGLRDDAGDSRRGSSPADAVTSFSVVPLRTVSALGVLVFLFSAGMGVWTL